VDGKERSGRKRVEGKARQSEGRKIRQIVKLIDGERNRGYRVGKGKAGKGRCGA